MPFVLNVSCKVKDFNPEAHDKEKMKQAQRDDLARFNKLLLLLCLLVAGFALSVTATSSTEWTVYGRDPTSLADYGIGIWFAHVSANVDHAQKARFGLALDRLIYCDESTHGGYPTDSADGALAILLLVGVDTVSQKIRRRYVLIASVSSLLQ